MTSALSPLFTLFSVMYLALLFTGLILVLRSGRWLGTPRLLMVLALSGRIGLWFLGWALSLATYAFPPETYEVLFLCRMVLTRSLGLVTSVLMVASLGMRLMTQDAADGAESSS